MATDIALVSQESGGADLTLFGTEQAAIAAGKDIYWIALMTGRESPWQTIHYPGSNAIRAKFMGAQPRTYTIRGVAFSIVTAIATMQTNVKTGMDSVMALSKVQDFYKITAGGIVIHDGEGLIVEDIASDFIGSGTGPRWVFDIKLRDLGTT